ncbi:MAG: clan AA aspartic protease [Planctomycetes bacterium]|nr:clan AA aspartic protease [Planctomycetota bacterium]
MKKNRRLIHVWAGIPLKDEEMGEVRVKVRLTNAADESLARRGLLKPEEIRSVETEAAVDTGAVRCVIPDGIRQRLGLSTTSRRHAAYADGRSEEVDVTEPVRIELEGRPTYEDCLVSGDEVLIGQTALESTDLFVDCVNGRLVPNPAHPNVIVSPVK